jgi:hypothetical protein
MQLDYSLVQPHFISGKGGRLGRPGNAQTLFFENPIGASLFSRESL